MGSDEFSPAGLRVLVVDGDISSTNNLVKHLTRWNYNVSKCTLAEAALDMLKQNEKYNFKIVMTDLNMGDRNGFEFLGIVAHQFGVPVILMTRDGNTNTVKRGIENGACDYFQKPISAKNVRFIWQHAFHKWLQQRPEIAGENSLANGIALMAGKNTMELGECSHGGNYFDGDYSRVAKKDSSSLANGNALMAGKNQMELGECSHGGNYFDGGYSRVAKKYSSSLANGNALLAGEKYTELGECGGNSRVAKKNRVIWTPELSKKFEEVVDELVRTKQKVSPINILEAMNEPQLTREQISSHLQKHRAKSVPAAPPENDANTCTQQHLLSAPLPQVSNTHMYSQEMSIMYQNASNYQNMYQNASNYPIHNNYQNFLHQIQIPPNMVPNAPYENQNGNQNQNQNQNPPNLETFVDDEYEDYIIDFPDLDQ